MFHQAEGLKIFLLLFVEGARASQSTVCHCMAGKTTPSIYAGLLKLSAKFLELLHFLLCMYCNWANKAGNQDSLSDHCNSCVLIFKLIKLR